mmetsp:Transcript_72832/g.152080  ORF Transcript_72832/g.152080 Transcript_72832/m.152080 type:complete len:201 (+) Transcript_72832:618-1220(+)
MFQNQSPVYQWKAAPFTYCPAWGLLNAALTYSGKRCFESSKTKMETSGCSAFTVGPKCSSTKDASSSADMVQASQAALFVGSFWTVSAQTGVTKASKRVIHVEIYLAQVGRASSLRHGEPEFCMLLLVFIHLGGLQGEARIFRPTGRVVRYWPPGVLKLTLPSDWVTLMNRAAVFAFATACRDPSGWSARNWPVMVWMVT